MSEGYKILKTTLSSIPEVAGIYKMLDSSGNILYIGKAKNLNHRLKNYLNKNLTTRIMHLVSNISSLEYVQTSTEADALLLESRLIKQYKPKYNILLKDDKSFPYIKLRMDHDFPQIIKYRGKVLKDGKYFGPFANVGEVNKILTFLHKTFKLRNCTDNYFAVRKRPCLQYQIGRCSAPCANKISVQDYQLSINEAIDFLMGRNAELQKKLSKQMAHASEEENYEKAAILRDKIKSLSYIQQEGGNHIELLHNIDVIGAVEEAGVVCIVVAFYRFGHFYGHKLFFNEITDANRGDDVISSFISNFYQSIPVPEEIIVNNEIEEKGFLAEALFQIYGTKVEITLPMKGIKKSLVNRALEFAFEGIRKKIQDDGVNDAIYEEMTEVFCLPQTPERIEIYDNSHIMGSHAIGAFVVATRDGFQKKEYRHYNVENKIGDDYAMLCEVLRRRLQKVTIEGCNKPGLLLIDGGKGHLSCAMDVMNELGIKVPVVAIAKGPERNAGKEVFYLTSGENLTFDKNKPLMKYLQILRDEAHRFAITTHRKKRAKSMGISSLDAIEDIGPIRKRALLEHFGSLDAIKSSSAEEIAKVKGISLTLAKNILSYIK